MKIPLNDILVVYEKIVKGINVAEISMILFVALDVDALCTLRILSVLSCYSSDIFKKRKYKL
jgi:hypothetical protein